mgnify:CR=1 FL=1
MDRNDDITSLMALAVGMATGNATEAIDAAQRAGQGDSMYGDKIAAKVQYHGKFDRERAIEELGCEPDDKRLPPDIEGLVILEHMGIEFEASASDKYFMPCKLPEGWKWKSQGGYGYWTDLYDENDRIRGSQFYKVWDEAFFRPCARFYPRKRYFEQDNLPFVQFEVLDSNGEVHFTSGTHNHYMPPSEGMSDEQRTRWIEEERQAEKAAKDAAKEAEKAAKDALKL